MKLLSMAWRNVFRHTRRSVITAAAISVGLMAMLAIDTLLNGTDQAGTRNVMDFETGQLVVYANGYYHEEGLLPLDTVITASESLLEVIRETPGVKAATRRIKFPARLTNGIDELPVTAIGLDPDHENEVFRTKAAIVAGDYLADPDGCLIGVPLARDIGADVDAPLTLICRDRNGTHNAYDLIVTGILHTAHPLLDRSALLVDLATAQELLSMPGEATEICVAAGSDPANVRRLQAALAHRLRPGYEVYRWDELSGALFQVTGIKRTCGMLVGLIVFIIASVGIVNTMLMAVMERIPEIGTLKALGFGNRHLVAIFLLEGAMIGGIGSAIGTCLGVIVSCYFVFVGLDFSSMFQGQVMDLPVEMVFRGDLSIGTAVLVFLFGVVVTVLVTLIPVRRAMGLQPVDALRHI